MRFAPRFVQTVLAACLAALLLSPGAARAQPGPAYTTTLDQPNPADFVEHTDTRLSFAGTPMRMGGMNIGWAALRSDTGRAADLRYPTRYEIDDVLATVQAMGGTVVRIVSAGASAGCALCIAPAAGQINPDALKQVDLILREARDMGLKVILPLAGAGCAAAPAADPVATTPCVFAAWRGLPPAAFFTDPQVKADFRRYAAAIVLRANTLTGTIYRDDPTILAWENCDACGAGAPPADVAAWTEELGAAIKVLDKHHLYENGAFAGHLAPSAAGAVPPALLALPSVDIIGDQIIPAMPGATTPPASLGDAAAAVTKTGRVYLIDAYGWTAKDWPSADDLDGFLTGLVRKRGVAGALVTNLSGHADQGGYLPPLAGPESGLYFPGFATGAASAEDMQARARVVRRFDYRIADLPVVAFATVAQPAIVQAEHGRIVWRGAAGASDYTVERTQDPHINGSWQAICQRCVTDATAPYQDPATPADPAWYRVTPYNANGHVGLPSDPVQSK